MKTLIAIIALAALGMGCSTIEFRTPERFKDKKQVEDPPLGMLQPEARHA